ncbi:MAG: acetyl-CoA carboxylase biotin carboxyl carrier protein subunit [Nocardia sp.]|uniref:acetyl-CoA carboxylase biotin carboxyl carrier protein n=1 Tax=Nocardia sp. TaxID=1821 RepID=UPI0026125205|nr:biotin/lipoyl-containing protein [Nocardia sp.]MCU1648803.1 acetyl-CoA carboxylase biotin carboxyl carrier protein subunit [Nocardia sp.]
MTDSVTTETFPDTAPTTTGGRAVSAAEADHSLTVLTRHALTVRADAAPTSVTVANGPVVLRVSWEGGSHGLALAPVVDSNRSAVPSAEKGVPQDSGLSRDNGGNGGSASQTATFALTAETVGVFYRSPEPGAAPFITEGDPVRAGQQVAIVEAMKLMIPITAAREGVVAEFLVEDGAAIEHGQPLIEFEALR